MYSKLAVVAVALVAAAGVFADDFTNNCNAQKRVCQNGGVCHENVASPIAEGSFNAWKDPYCICQAPYGGSDCSRTIRECKDNPCQNGATCHPAECTSSTNTQNQYYDCFTCECPYGWTRSPSYSSSSNTGGLCDWKMEGTNCKSGAVLCANGGTCQDQANIGNMMAYSCQCTTGWLGGQTGQGTGINPPYAAFANVAYNCTVPDCTTSAGQCQNGGTCIAGSGTTANRCSCGFYGGYRCELPRFCDNPTACPDGYTCSNTGPGTGSCSAPSFCSTHTCLNGGTCMNSGGPGGGAYCACPGNFDGGLSCNSTLFCASNPCQNGGTCSNSLSYAGNAGSCSCPVGFAGQFCEKPIIGCASGRTKSSDPVKCAQSLGISACNIAEAVSTCRCTYNYGGLSNYDCGCNSTMVSRCPGAVGGSNVAGYEADMVCQNGGICVESIDGAGCGCRPGFWGDKCQNYDNPCLNSPCENGGQCYITAETNTLTQGSYYAASDDRFWAWRCRCKWPFYGKNCEKQAPVPGWDGKAPVVCGDSNSPCMNGGTCSARNYDVNAGGFFDSDPYTGYDVEAEPWRCTCPSPSAYSYGYIGMRCEIQVEQCSSTTCQNGGKCFNNGGGVSCTCPCGYAGDRCEIPATNINAASVAQFANDGAGGIGYRLEFCSREPCQNGGTCYHTTNGQSFGCSCKSGWAGTYCQYSVRSAAAGVVPSLVAVAAAVAVAFALKH